MRVFEVDTVLVKELATLGIEISSIVRPVAATTTIGMSGSRSKRRSGYDIQVGGESEIADSNVT